MDVLIIGAAGMVGAKLAAALASDPTAGVRRLALVDVVEPKAPAGAVPSTTAVLNLTDAAAVEAAVAARPDVIFHLAAIVSGEAEADFDKGYAVSFDGTRALFEAIRHQPGYHPRVVFTSSIAVFGTPFPDPIPDEFHLTPLTSYGTQRRWASFCSTTIRAAASSTAWASGCRRSACGPACRTRRPRDFLEHPARAAGGA